MIKRIQIFCILVALMTPHLVFASGQGLSQSQILSFSDWKKDKVQGAKEQISDTKNKIQLIQGGMSGKSHSMKDPQLMAVQQQLNEHEFNLEIAEDLGITDYIVLYLSGQNNSQHLKEAAAKMTTEETAQLLEAYIKVVRAQNQDRGILKLPRHSNEKE